MARPRNEEAERRIMACAFRQMLAKGYRKTSYQSVFEEVGYSRAYIQHYVPKKEMFLQALMEGLLALCDEAVGRSGRTDGLYCSMFLTGQIYFAFLSDRRHRALALDILESRLLTQRVITINERYEALRTGADADSQQSIADGLVRLMGGTYELMYQRLYRSKEISPAGESLHIVTGFLDLSGVDAAPIASECASLAFSRRELKSITASIEARLSSAGSCK